MTTSVPLFLSSALSSSSTSEGAFSRQLTPPLRIPENAKRVSVSVDSATIPFSFPNLTATTAQVMVQIPKSTTPSTQTGLVALTLPTGVYDLTEIAQQLNLAVNTYLHTNGFPVLKGTWTYYDFATDSVKTAADVANFCTLLPNFHSNRVELTLNYDHSVIDFAHGTTTLDDLLGFTSRCERTVAAQLVIPGTGYALEGSFRTVEYGGSTPSWANVTFTVAAGTYTAASFCTAVNAAFVAAVSARGMSASDTPQVPAATATGPLLSSVALQASEETSGEYRVDFEYANATAGNPVGTCLLGNYDASSVLTTTQDEQDFMAAVLGTYGYFDTTNNHTRASLWAGAQTTPFVAERAATVDKVTEVGISAPGLSHGSYSSSGSSTGATLARFQVTGRPGTNMVYRPSQPIKIDASHLINTRLQEVSLALVDQHGTRLDSLQGEKYSVVLVVEWEE